MRTDTFYVVFFFWGSHDKIGGIKRQKKTS